MDRNERSTIFGFAFLVVLAGLLVACRQDGDVPTDETTETAALSTASTYDLEVFFDGLIAFVQDEDQAGRDRVWALLVDAEYDLQDVDPYLNGLSKDELPDCVWDEARTDATPRAYVEGHYPAHEARIRIRQATVTDSNGQIFTGRFGSLCG